MHFNGTSHPSIGKPCATLGVKAYGTAPPCYTANVSVLSAISPETFSMLASTIASMTPKQCRVLMGLLKTAGSLEKFGFTFLQKVYFRLGPDYLDNYYSGYVLGTGVDKTISIVGKSYFKGAKKPVIASILQDSVVSVEVFKKRKKKLLAEGKLYEPRKVHKNEITEDYEPPTIETAQETLEEMAKYAGKKRVKNNKLKMLEVVVEKDAKMPVMESEDA
jgi:hypothetical protein